MGTRFTQEKCYFLSFIFSNYLGSHVLLELAKECSLYIDTIKDTFVVCIPFNDCCMVAGTLIGVLNTEGYMHAEVRRSVLCRRRSSSLPSAGAGTDRARPDESLRWWPIDGRPDG